MTALTNRANLAVPVNNANAEIGLLAMYDALNEATEKPELDIASASTCDIGGQASTKLRITGTTTITSFGTVYRGPILIRMAAALTITHNGTALVCPGSADLVLAAGDVLMAWPKTTTSGASNGWQVVVLSFGTSAAERAAIGAVGMTGNETITGNKTFSGVTAIGGTTTNDNAATGYVGEYVQAAVAGGSAVSLVATVAKTVTSITLTAGDWDVDGVVNFNFAANTSVESLFGASSLVANSIDAYAFSHRCGPFVPGAVAMGYTIPTRRFSLATTTAVYLVASGGFTVGTCAAWGLIRARRVR